MEAEGAAAGIKLSVVLDGVHAFFAFPCCLLDLLFRLGLQLLCPLLALVFFDLLGCELVDVGVRQAVLADGPQEELIGLEQSAFLDDVFLGLGLGDFHDLLLNFETASVREELPLGGLFSFFFGLGAFSSTFLPSLLSLSFAFLAFLLSLSLDLSSFTFF